MLASASPAAYRPLSRHIGLFLLIIGWSLASCAPDAAPGTTDARAEVLNVPALAAAERVVSDCEALRQWMHEHPGGFAARVQKDGHDLSLQYRPAECMACLEQEHAVFAQPAFDARRHELSASESYVLRVHGPADSDRRALLNEDIRRHLIEVVGTDTFPCVFAHVESLPASAPYASVLIGFDRAQDGQDRQVIWRDAQGKPGGDVVFGFTGGGLGRFAKAVRTPSTSDRS